MELLQGVESGGGEVVVVGARHQRVLFSHTWSRVFATSSKVNFGWIERGTPAAQIERQSFE